MSDVPEKILRRRNRALDWKRNLCKERSDGHQSLLRDLYHLMTQNSALSAPTASIRAGDESPELQSFLNEYGLWNPNHRSTFDVPFSPALTDTADDEEEDVKPSLESLLASSSKVSPVIPDQTDGASSSSQSPIPGRTFASAVAPPSRRPRPISPERSRIDPPPASTRSLSRFTDSSDPGPSTGTMNRSSFHDNAMAMDYGGDEEDPPPTRSSPRATINPNLLRHTPSISLPIHYESSFSSLAEPKDVPPLPTPSDLALDPILAPLVTEYAASLYPLPPEVTTKKRKKDKENKRYTIRGTPVVDLDRWEAIMTVNPASRLAKKANKCLSTREWEIMYHEVRFVKALQRIQELKLSGRWSFRQPKKHRGPTIYKAHWDYMLDEMKWLQTDFREERKWKIAVAYELAHSAAEWVRADPEIRRLLTFRWTRELDDEVDVEGAGNSDDAEDAGSPSKRRRLSPRPDEMDVDAAESSLSDPSLTRARRTIAMQEANDEEEEEEEDEDDDDDDDDRARNRSVSRDQQPQPQSRAQSQTHSHFNNIISLEEDTKQPLPLPNSGPLPSELVIELEEAGKPLQVPAVARLRASASASGSATPAPPGLEGVVGGRTQPGSEADGDGDPDEEMDADGDVDSGRGSRGVTAAAAATAAATATAATSTTANLVPKIEPKPEQESISLATAPVPVKASATKSGLKAGREDVPVSSAAGSLLDPKLLRGPILDLSMEHTFVDLSDLFNRGLSLEDRVPAPDKNDITLASLFPELSVYEFADPPPQGENVNDKKHKRVDESGMSVGRLTYTSRLMDSNNVLLSSLQPGRKYRKGVWDDPSDLPIAEEPRDYSKAPPDVIPPSAPMFFGTKAKDHIHPPLHALVPEPHDAEARSVHFVWTGEEEQLLRSLYNQFGPNWGLISDVLNSSRITIPTDVRGPWDCSKRWKTLESGGDGVGEYGNMRRDGRPVITPKKVTHQVANARAAGGRRPMRHAIVLEVIKKLIIKRAAKAPIKARSTATLHDTHLQVSQQKHLTPAELSRAKQERDSAALKQAQAHEAIQRKAEMQRMAARQAGQLPQPQMQQLPNIAQQPRLGLGGSPMAAGQPQRQGPQLTPQQQQAALLQIQQRAQQLGAQGFQNNPQMQQMYAAAQAQAVMAAQQNAQNGQQPNPQNVPNPAVVAAAAAAAAAAQNGGQQSSSSPALPHSSPHPGAALPNNRPPSSGSMVQGSPQMTQYTAQQVQAAALAYSRAAQQQAANGDPSKQTNPAVTAQSLQQMIWHQQRQAAAQAQLAQQQAAAASQAQQHNQGPPSSSPHPPNAPPAS